MMKRLTLLAPILLAGCVVQSGPVAWTPARVPLSVDEIAAMRRAGTSDDTIRRDLQANGVERKLTADDLVALKEAGAGDSLLAAAASAPVLEPEDAQPLYHRHLYSYDQCVYCGAYAPAYFALGFAFNNFFFRCHRGFRTRWSGSGARW
jgi:hypothetical protein